MRGRRLPEFVPQATRILSPSRIRPERQERESGARGGTPSADQGDAERKRGRKERESDEEEETSAPAPRSPGGASPGRKPRPVRRSLNQRIGLLRRRARRHTQLDPGLPRGEPPRLALRVRRRRPVGDGRDGRDGLILVRRGEGRARRGVLRQRPAAELVRRQPRLDGGGRGGGQQGGSEHGEQRVLLRARRRGDSGGRRRGGGVRPGGRDRVGPDGESRGGGHGESHGQAVQAGGEYVEADGGADGRTDLLPVRRADGKSHFGAHRGADGEAHGRADCRAHGTPHGGSRDGVPHGQAHAGPVGRSLSGSPLLLAQRLLRDRGHRRARRYRVRVPTCRSVQPRRTRAGGGAGGRGVDGAGAVRGGSPTAGPTGSPTGGTADPTPMWHPHFASYDETTETMECIYGTTYPAVWSDPSQRDAHLFDTEEGCCEAWRCRTEDAGTSGEDGGRWLQSEDGTDCVYLVLPPGMLGADFLFETKEGCCEVNDCVVLVEEAWLWNQDRTDCVFFEFEGEGVPDADFLFGTRGECCAVNSCIERDTAEPSPSVAEDTAAPSASPADTVGPAGPAGPAGSDAPAAPPVRPPTASPAVPMSLSPTGPGTPVGPATVRSLTMTVVGVAPIDPELWSDATERYIEEYFNGGGVGASGVEVEIKVTGQDFILEWGDGGASEATGERRSNLFAGTPPGGLRRRRRGQEAMVASAVLFYDQTSTFVSLDPATYDAVYVARAPFATAQGRERYAARLREVRPRFESVLSTSGVGYTPHPPRRRRRARGARQAGPDPTATSSRRGPRSGRSAARPSSPPRRCSCVGGGRPSEGGGTWRRSATATT
ncbi:hypothetical protein THAOC_24541 [Thalassiosira oceanica]|uniref:Uncharacterized protein n=1 Tax=Thalassiosira oceanica TaxID=159749 RepID=K0RRU6_THAOC|nr:hypothetical protein THAOC_24541 [Thalassiosira oceanica]|eukprot:EJK55700.1 hypothetical protein THAOC_24541 [Thalassiosira oceanica]